MDSRGMLLSMLSGVLVAVVVSTSSSDRVCCLLCYICSAGIISGLDVGRWNDDEAA